MKFTSMNTEIALKFSNVIVRDCQNFNRTMSWNLGKQKTDGESIVAYPEWQQFPTATVTIPRGELVVWWIAARV